MIVKKFKKKSSLGPLWLQNLGRSPLRLANPRRRHSLWKTDSEKLIFKQAWNDMWRQLRWGFQGLSWTGARQIWYPVISPLKWRQDQQLPSLWVRWWNMWFGPRLMSPWQPGNIFIQNNIVVLLFFCTHLPSFICYHSLYVCVLAVCGRPPVFSCHVCWSFWCVCEVTLWPNRPVEERCVTGRGREPDPPGAEWAAMLSEGIWSRAAVEGVEVDRGIQPHTTRTDGRAGKHFCVKSKFIFKVLN